MNNKKGIMFFASILIIIFHLWIYLTNSSNWFHSYEVFMRSICYIGVDIFFFLSAYSISKVDFKEYKNFIKSRFIKIYGKYIIFSLIAFVYFSWPFLRFIKVIIGFDFICKGGGSFLWFVPAIMLTYILLPLYKRYESKYLFILLIIGIIISNIFLANNPLLIIINRIPIILLGYYFYKHKLFDLMNFKIALSLFLFGIVLLYNTTHINYTPYNNIRYIIAIPFSIGIIGILNNIKPNKIVDYLGKYTLEIYAFQMIIGFKLAGVIYNIFKISIISNIVTIILIIIISIMFDMLLEFIKSKKELLNFKVS